MGEFHDFWGDDIDEEDANGLTGWDKLSCGYDEDYPVKKHRNNEENKGCFFIIVFIILAGLFSVLGPLGWLIAFFLSGPVLDGIFGD